MHPIHSNNAAILFFSLSANIEGNHKQFVSDHGNRRNVNIARSLIEHTRNQISRAGLPFYTIDENLQEGSSFGERFTSAFTKIFNKGFDYVIAVGNDTPQLKAQHLTEAAFKLSSGTADIVLGPAEDGGAWLMGYSRKAFEARSFQLLPWNSPSLLESILKQTGDEVAISLLEAFADIDNPASLVAFVKNFRSDLSLSKLIRLIKAVLSDHTHLFKNGSYLIPSPLSFPVHQLRAPPRKV